MSITIRPYDHPEDFKLVGDFLIDHYQPGNKDGNWLQPAWEYMHSHPSLDEASLHKIGLWEDASKLVGVVHYESELGEVFFEIDPTYTCLKGAMLEYAETHLYGEMETGQRYVKAFINDFDLEFETIAQSRGYKKDENLTRPTSQMMIPDPFPLISLAKGFHLKSLAEDNDLSKIHRVLWRGFDHAGEPPAAGIEWRKKMQSGPNFRKELTIVIEAPTGDFVSFCGTWYEATNRIAYVEPVATDPDFRGRGLGKAAVLEGLRRCGLLGATVAFVGSDQKFYQALGFKKIFTSNCWVKTMSQA